MLDGAGGVGEGQGDGHGDKVDVGDVREHLLRVVRELAEVPGDVDAGVRRVGDGWLDERGAAGTGVDEKLQGLADREPDTSTGDLGDCARLRCPGAAKWNGAVLSQRGVCRGWVGRVVRSLAIRLDEDDSVVVVDRLAGDEAVDGRGAVGLVDEIDLDGRWSVCGIATGLSSTGGSSSSCRWIGRRRWAGGGCAGSWSAIGGTIGSGAFCGGGPAGRRCGLWLVFVFVSQVAYETG